jgi:hypothetical protein
MSSVKIAGDTSGLITLAAPAAAGTNTITMPASTGTMALTSDIVVSDPSGLQINKTVTGAVTALRAVSVAADASVGAYPTVNTLSSQVQSVTNPTMVFLDGVTGETSIRMVISGSGPSNVATLYGQYLNGSRQWVENSTPLAILLSLASGTAINLSSNVYPRGQSTQANTFLVYQGCSRNDGIESAAQCTAIKVNPATGAPTIEGTSAKRSITNGTGYGGANVLGQGDLCDGYYKTSLYASGAYRQGVQFRYVAGSGFSYQDIPNEAMFNKLATNYEYYNMTLPAGYTQLSGDGSRIYFTVADHAQTFRRQTITSNYFADEVDVNITVPSADYLSDGKTLFLDATHFIFYYQNTNNVWAIKTFSISGDTPSLIDTFLCPDNYEKCWDLARKTSDTKNLIGTVFNANAAGEDFVFSIGLAADYTIDGVCPIQKIPINSSIRAQPRCKTGNIFNLHQNTGGKVTNQTYTVNAYSTIQFVYSGMATASASSGTTPIRIGGISSGHSGLTIGDSYFVKTTLDGQITNVSGDSSPNRVGKAISATEIVLGDIT